VTREKILIAMGDPDIGLVNKASIEIESAIFRIR
jgi:hypothetical protein